MNEWERLLQACTNAAEDQVGRCLWILMDGARVLLRWEVERGLIRFQERSDDAKLYEINASFSIHDRTPSPDAHECKAIELPFRGLMEMRVCGLDGAFRG
jgi:hypothetical protein